MSDTSKNNITSEQKHEIANFLKEKAPQMKCNACGKNHFSIADHLVQAPIFSHDGLTIGGPTYPMFCIFCKNCGSAQFFSAIKSGIINKEGQD